MKSYTTILFILAIVLSTVIVGCEEPTEEEGVKTVYLVRHAETKKPKEDKKDIDRKLKRQGKEQAKKMGKQLDKKDIVVQKIYSSTAKRATSTAEQIAKKLDLHKKNIVEQEVLYKSTTPVYIKFIQQLPDSLDQVMIVGHNPSTIEAINYFQKDTIFADLPVGSIVAIKMKTTTWKNLGHKSGQFSFFMPTPVPDDL